MTRDLFIGIVAGIISGLITTALVAILKWQIARLKGDLSERLTFWFYTHLKQIVIAGVLVNAFLLAWVLLKFPTVTLWSVLAIVLSVVLMGFEIGVFLLIWTLEGVINGISRNLKNWANAQAEKSSPKV